MDTSAIDFPALLLAILVAATITVSLGYAQRGDDRRRSWLTAAALTVVLIGIGLADLLQETPRETHVATLFIGIPLPVLGAMGLLRATRRARPWLRWTSVYLVTLVLLLGGLLLGAAVAPRFLPA
jgi:uncharacterized membrane protein HdeD (DUF308 family)